MKSHTVHSVPISTIISTASNEVEVQDGVGLWINYQFPSPGTSSKSTRHVPSQCAWESTRIRHSFATGHYFADGKGRLQERSSSLAFESTFLDDIIEMIGNRIRKFEVASPVWGYKFTSI